MSNEVRVALVNDQPLFTRGLTLLLPAVTDSRVRIVATTNDGSLASGLVRRVRPDLALVDLAIPDPGGLRVIAAIHRAEPDIPVVAMSDAHHATSGLSANGATDAAADSSEALQALRAGAVGYLRKIDEPEHMVLPLLAAASGWAVLPRDVLGLLLGASPDVRLSNVLDDADRRLWRLIARGSTLGHIAAEMHVSERTAKRLTAALLRRLRVGNRAQACTLAGQAGLIVDHPAASNGTASGASQA